MLEDATDLFSPNTSLRCQRIRPVTRKADLAYLRILKLAARTMESDVAWALGQLVARAEQWDETDVERLVEPQPIEIPVLTVGEVELEQYDRLLTGVSHGL